MKRYKIPLMALVTVVGLFIFSSVLTKDVFAVNIPVYLEVGTPCSQDVAGTIMIDVGRFAGWDGNSPDGLSETWEARGGSNNVQLHLEGTPTTGGTYLYNIGHLNEGEPVVENVVRIYVSAPITVNKSGGGTSTASASSTSALPERRINLTATPASGYSFVNWTSESAVTIDNATSATGASFYMPSNAVTITANFSQNPPSPTVYNVTVTTDGHGEAYANKRSGVSGTNVVLREVPDDGYRFKQWEVISGGVVLDNYRDYTTSFTINSANVVIKAHFEKKEEHTRENDYGPEESKSEAAWTPEKAAATIAAEKAAKQQTAGTQMAAVQTLLRTLATTKPGGPGENPTVINLDMTKVDILDPATVNLLTLNRKFEYNIKISEVGGLTNTVKIPANFNFRTFIKADGTMNIHEVLWSIVKSKRKKGPLY